MAKKRPIRRLHFFTLLTIKEGYLGCRNLLGLLLHPFKTITVLSRERDPIQILFIFGLPFYFWLGGVASLVILRFVLYRRILALGFLAKFSLILITFGAGLISSYLIYWFVLYLKKKKTAI